jgi:outer membrane lipoprotein
MFYAVNRVLKLWATFMQRVMVVLLFCFISFGCSHLPEELSVAEKIELLPFDEVGDMDLVPTNYQALWGGVIAKTVNYTDRTQIEVVYFPLNDRGEPDESQESLGRFKVYIGDFVDPYVYRPGRLVTVLGTLGVREKGYVGNYFYDYTVLHALKLHLWEGKNVLPFLPSEEPQENRRSLPVFSYQ